MRVGGVGGGLSLHCLPPLNQAQRKGHLENLKIGVTMKIMVFFESTPTFGETQRRGFQQGGQLRY